jgi:hypothetical protein
MSDLPPFYIGVSRALTDRQLSRGDLAVLGALCSFYNRKTGECFPSLASIAERAGLKRTRAWDVLGHLQELGYIEIHAQWNPITGAQRSNQYDIFWTDDSSSSFTPMPDVSDPPVSDVVNPPVHPDRTPPPTTAERGPSTLTEPKQRTELRSEQTKELINRTPRKRAFADKRSVEEKRALAHSDLFEALFSGTNDA